MLYLAYRRGGDATNHRITLKHAEGKKKKKITWADNVTSNSTYIVLSNQACRVLWDKNRVYGHANPPGFQKINK